MFEVIVHFNVLHFRIQFQRITKAEHTGRNCVLRVLNDNASEVDIVLRHSTLSGANALYRCVTEMHSFFFCSTVHDEVSMQFSRDFKGTIASLFNEHSTLGEGFVTHTVILFTLSNETLL